MTSPSVGSDIGDGRVDRVRGHRGELIVLLLAAAWLTQAVGCAVVAGAAAGAGAGYVAGSAASDDDADEGD